MIRYFTIRAILPILICVSFAYWVYFGDRPFGNSPAEWGAFGDFFGGIFNPLVALAAFGLLYRSVSIQRKELGRTTQALKDANESHSEQVELGRLSCEIERLKLQFQKVDTALTAAYNYRNTIIEKGTISGLAAKVLDASGQIKQAPELLEEVNNQIYDLDSKAQGLIDAISKRIKDYDDSKKAKIHK